MSANFLKNRSDFSQSGPENQAGADNQSEPGKQEVVEASLLFTVFFLPGYLMQPRGFDPALFTSLSFNANYLLYTLPRIGLIVYLLYITRGGHRQRYGLRKLSLQTLPASLFTFAGAMGISMLMSLIALAAGLPGPFEQTAGAAAAAGAPTLLMVPIIAVTCITVGYYEELFFRAYLLGVFAYRRSVRIPAAVATSLLFAAGHGYQGAVGFVGTFGIGLFLAYRFFRRPSVHHIAIGHGLYNLAAVLLLLLSR